MIALGATAPAHACKIAEGNGPIRLFWDKLPVSLEPGEVVLKIRFSRGAPRRGDDADSIVIDCTSRNVFSVVESRPLTSAVSEILIVGPYDFDPKRAGFVVGKLAPPSELPPDGFRVLDADAAWRFKPRS